ncbi:hypothetical protein AB7W40_13865 [Providencia rettgeri]
MCIMVWQVEPAPVPATIKMFQILLLQGGAVALVNRYPNDTAGTNGYNTLTATLYIPSSAIPGTRYTGTYYAAVTNAATSLQRKFEFDYTVSSKCNINAEANYTLQLGEPKATFSVICDNWDNVAACPYITLTSDKYPTGDSYAALMSTSSGAVGPLLRIGVPGNTPSCANAGASVNHIWGTMRQFTPVLSGGKGTAIFTAVACPTASGIPASVYSSRVTAKISYR